MDRAIYCLKYDSTYSIIGKYIDFCCLQLHWQPQRVVRGWSPTPSDVETNWESTLCLRVNERLREHATRKRRQQADSGQTQL